MRIPLLFLALPLAAHLHAADPVALFNGKDLSGWTFDISEPGVAPTAIWSVVDGVLVCAGNPAGVIRTEKDHANYELTVEYRWAPGKKAGNSGVLIHSSSPRNMGIWPKSLEVQLASGSAGDFWKIGEIITVPDQAKRQEGRNARNIPNLTDHSEKPVGEWNTMVIRAEGDKVRVQVNGELVNEGSGCSVTKGAICLQSEGAEIHFRKVVLTPLAP